MKTTNKKLAKKHFRYLNKREIDQPLFCLDTIYNSQTNFNFLLNEIDHFLRNGLDPRLKVKGIDYNYIAQLFIRQIEIAYVFYISARLRKYANTKVKLKSVKDRYRYLKDTSNTPARVIQVFFRFMNLKKWREEVDYITCTASNELQDYFFEAHEDAMMIYTHGLQLVRALHQIYQDGGLEIELPHYITPKIRADPEEMSAKSCL